MRNVLIATLTLLVLVPATTRAEPASALAQQAAQLFEQRRNIEATSHRERIAILETADACIDQAADFQTFRRCESEEQAARDALRERLAPEVQALRSQWQALRKEAPAHRGRPH